MHCHKGAKHRTGWRRSEVIASVPKKLLGRSQCLKDRIRRLNRRSLWRTRSILEALRRRSQVRLHRSNAQSQTLTLPSDSHRIGVDERAEGGLPRSRRTCRRSLGLHDTQSLQAAIRWQHHRLLREFRQAFTDHKMETPWDTSIWSTLQVTRLGRTSTFHICWRVLEVTIPDQSVLATQSTVQKYVIQ